MILLCADCQNEQKQEARVEKVQDVGGFNTLNRLLECLSAVEWCLFKSRRRVQSL